MGCCASSQAEPTGQGTAEPAQVEVKIVPPGPGGKKIQFIAYEVCTMPHGFDTKDTTDDDFYLGVRGDLDEDVRRRAELLSKAVAAAAANPHVDPEALKIFIVPEFFWRGPAGAYNVDQVFKKLRETHALDYSSYKDWTFVFGTVVCCDQLQDPAEPGFDYAVYNLALITGEDNKQVVGVLKSYRSKLDFLADSKLGGLVEKDGALLHMSGNVCACLPSAAPNPGLSRNERSTSIPLTPSGPVPPSSGACATGADWRGPVSVQVSADLLAPRVGEHISSASIDEDGIFTCRGITWGLEVCLDHAERRLAKSAAKDKVRVQLLTSAGMSVKEESVVVPPGGLVFHADGLHAVDAACYGAHSSAFQKGPDGGLVPVPLLHRVGAHGDAWREAVKDLYVALEHSPPSIAVYAPCAVPKEA